MDAPRGQTGKAGLSATLSLNKVAVANYCQSTVRWNEIVEEAQVHLEIQHVNVGGPPEVSHQGDEGKLYSPECETRLTSRLCSETQVSLTRRDWYHGLDGRLTTITTAGFQDGQ